MPVVNGLLIPYQELAALAATLDLPGVTEAAMLDQLKLLSPNMGNKARVKEGQGALYLPVMRACASRSPRPATRWGEAGVCVGGGAHDFYLFK